MILGFSVLFSTVCQIENEFPQIKIPWTSSYIMLHICINMMLCPPENGKILWVRKYQEYKHEVYKLAKMIFCNCLSSIPDEWVSSFIQPVLPSCFTVLSHLMHKNKIKWSLKNNFRICTYRYVCYKKTDWIFWFSVDIILVNNFQIYTFISTEWNSTEWKYTITYLLNSPIYMSTWKCKSWN